MFPAPIVPIRTRLKPIGGKFELTPLVDVLFLLLIFFMVSSSFVRVSGIKVELPQTDYQTSWGVGKCVITIQADGKLFFNDHPVNSEGLKRNFHTISNRVTTVIVRADENTPYRRVAEIISLVSEYGLSPLLATFPPDKNEAELPDAP